MLLKSMPWKSTWSPKATLSVLEPVRMPRLPIPYGGATFTPPKSEVGPARRKASPLPITLRSTMLQFGPAYVVFNEFLAAELRSLVPIVPFLILADVTELSFSRSVVIAFFFRRSPARPPFLTSDP